ncbi:hypothetical protein A9P82_06185 [Arachidicoccus ginsenosidimutans]|nr:hypothetical protein A9P82_06185 [Arachidicoccus sp. BS20]
MVDIKYEQIVELVKQLPESKIVQLKSFLEKKNSSKNKASAQKKNDLQTLLLNGPTMSDEQYETFLQNRKMFNQWRTK